MEALLKRKQFLMPLIFGITFSIIYTKVPFNLFIELIGAFVIGILCIYNIRIGLISCVFMLPFLSDMLLLIYMIFIFAIFIFNNIYKKDYRLKSSFTDIPIVIFVLVIIISTLTSINVSGSFRDLAIHLCSISLVIVLVSSINNKHELNILLTVFVLAGTIVSLYGIYQYLIGVSMDAHWIDKANNPGIISRVYSVFGNPNILAEYLIMVIPISISLILTSRKISKKILFTLTSLVSLVALALTFSRGGWLGITLAILLFLFLIKKRLILISIPIAIIGMYTMPESIINRFASIGNVAESSNAGRIEVWKTTVEIIKNNWISGVGFGYIPFKQTLETYTHVDGLYHAHNTYLEIFAELGLGGMLLFAIMIFIMYKYALLTYIKTKDKYIKYITVGLIASISALLIQGLVEHVFYLTKIISTFWILVGCLLIVTRLDNEEI